MKQSADDNFEFDENTRKFSKQVENIVSKGEIARYEQFLFFLQCFQTACFPGASKGVIVWEWVKAGGLLIQVVSNTGCTVYCRTHIQSIFNVNLAQKRTFVLELVEKKRRERKKKGFLSYSIFKRHIPCYTPHKINDLGGIHESICRRQKKL